MNYKASIELIRSRWNAPAQKERERRFRRMPYLLKRLGSPQKDFRVCHIAGTKGKGSVAVAIASVLSRRYVTGLFTSPHLHTVRERIKIDGGLIGPRAFAALTSEIAQILRLADKIDSEPVNGFEILTAIAFLYFSRSRVDWAVIEVGMGGRVDPTNVVVPEISVMTDISYDHTDYLGNTISAIATAKAGIIKRHVPVVSASQLRQAAGVLQKVSKKNSSPLYLGGREWNWKGTSSHLDVIGPFKKYERLRVPLFGCHQLENFALAATTLDVLCNKGRVRLTKSDFRQGLASVYWPGRLEVIARNPLLIVDGAHNGRSAERLANALSTEFRYRRLFLIIGIGREKSINAIVYELAPITHFAAATRSSHVDAVDPEVIVDEFRQLGVKCKAFLRVRAAIKELANQAHSDDLMCVTGSLYLVADVRKLLSAPGSTEDDPH